jgi:molybdopterin-guanine dinucleotide biosynthesis protein A
VSDPGVTAIVLAGGRSSRFGRDKLAEPIDGHPLLAHAIEAVRPYSTEILVVAAPGATLVPPGAIMLVHDAVAFEGPLAGALAGLRAASEPVVLVVGGDMPWLVGAVLEFMLAEFERSDADAVVLETDDRPRPLPMVLRRDPGFAAAERLLGAGDRRLRAILEALETRIVPEAVWRMLDPKGRTIRDIDTQADLVDP